MEKRVLLAAILSSVFLLLYSQTVSRTVLSRQADRQTIPENSTKQVSEDTNDTDVYQLPKNEQLMVLDSDKISLYLGEASGSVRKVGIKHLNGKSDVVWFEGDQPFFAIRTINGEKLSWKSVGVSPKSVEFIASTSSGDNYYISYSIDLSNNLLSIELSEINNDIKIKDKQLEIGTYWQK